MNKRMRLRLLLSVLYVCIGFVSKSQVLEFQEGDAVEINLQGFTYDTHFTVEAWVKTSENFANILSKDSATTSPSFSLSPTQFSISGTYINPSNNAVSFATHDLTSSVLIDNSRWHHVAGVYDGSFMYFYLNGCLISQRDVSGVLLNSNSFPLTLGQDLTTSDSPFIGQMDEVMLWDTPRTEAEILLDMQGLVNPTAIPELVAYYNFETDLSNQKNPGTNDGFAVGSPSFVADDVKPEAFAIDTLISTDARCDVPEGTIEAFPTDRVASISPSYSPDDLKQGTVLTNLYGGTYQVLVQDDFGCRREGVVEVLGSGISPSVATGNGNGICAGSTLNIGVTNPDNNIDFVAWSGPDGFSDTANFIFISNINHNQEGTYYAKVVNSDGCVQINPVFVDVIGFSGPLTISSNEPVCQHGELILDNPVPNAFHAWSGPNNFSSSRKQAHRYEMALSDEGNYQLTVTKDGCMYGPSFEYVNVLSAPFPPNISADKGAYCFGDTIFLSADNIAGADYSWFGPNFFSNGQNTYVANASELDSGSYYCTITLGNCPSDSAELSLVVFENSAPNLGNDSTFCHTDELVLFPGSYQDYLWHDGTTGPTFNVMEGDSIWLTVADENNCVTTDTLYLEPFCPGKLYVPNAFTPNDDAWNKEFKAEGINISAFHLQIFTRTGTLVFESYNINEGWDGFYNNKPAPVGEYIWVIDYTQRRLSGEIEASTNGSVALMW